MEFEAPEFTLTQVRKAGIIYMDAASSAEDKFRALNIINNWRASHQYPLNATTDGLRKKARKLTPKGNVVQRIKRLRAIEDKLERETIKLNQMQDIGGCRAIVANVSQVRALVKSYNRKSSGVKITDYIEKPRATGYRGVHIVHTYCSKQYPAYNGLKIEMQIRTEKQHLWATGVETVGYYINQPLKSNKGDPNWLWFFQLLSTAIALQEGTTLIKNTPTTRIQVCIELVKAIEKIHAIESIIFFGEAAKTLSDPKNVRGDSHFLIELNTITKEMTVTGFKEDSIETAQKAYQEAEKNKIEGINVVLASASSYAALKKAYPNYFLDTKKFVGLIASTLKFLGGKELEEYTKNMTKTGKKNNHP